MHPLTPSNTPSNTPSDTLEHTLEHTLESTHFFRSDNTQQTMSQKKTAYIEALSSSPKGAAPTSPGTLSHPIRIPYRYTLLKHPINTFY